MDCERAREALLEADRPMLRGEGASALAGHLRGCDRCARLARIILREEAALARALDGLSRDRGGGGAGSGSGEARRAARTSRPRAVRSLAWAGAPLAAAAAAVLWLVAREPDPPPPVPDPAVVLADPAPFVTAPADRRTAVLRTDDPDITVVWFY